MRERQVRPAYGVSIMAGSLAGLATAYVDNVAFQGEVSPVVVVAMIFITTAVAGFFWRNHGGIAALIIWICVPGVHVMKRLLGMRDTLYPHTWLSVFKLALFSLLVAIAGFGAGLLLRSQRSQTRR